jgi:hypothetical protein
MTTLTLSGEQIEAIRVCLKHCLHEVVENSNSDLYHSLGENCPTVIANLLEDVK